MLLFLRRRLLGGSLTSVRLVLGLSGDHCIESGQIERLVGHVRSITLP